MNNTTAYPARYQPTAVRRFKDNPFIEALPKIEKSRTEFLTNLAHYPPTPTGAVRRSGDIVRMMELSTLNDIVFPFPEYQKANMALAMMIRETYVARNPLTITDRQRRHALAARETDGLPFPADWKSSAQGHCMLAISGMGKTTFAKAFLLRYPQIIKHTEYMGGFLQCHQVVYLFLRVPHDATLKSLCIQFFDEIDRLLGTKYSRQARGVRHIAPMVQLMHRVATTVSLGLLVIDEVQNLRNARGDHAEQMLNLFSEIIERLGISLLVLATPAVQRVTEGSVRNTRKLVSEGDTVIRPMSRKDPQWVDFCETYWDYTYVRRKGTLTEHVRDAWFRASAGNTAFAVLAFKLAQRSEIGGREVVDVTAFDRVAAVDLAFLQPAISALLSGKPERLRAFDDLLFGRNYAALRRLMGMDPPDVAKVAEEFEDLDTKDAGHKKSKRSRSSSKNRNELAVDYDLPLEDPLLETSR